MLDPELKTHLEKIENELLHTRLSASSLRRTFWRGCTYGAGYVIGAICIIVIAGWILNLVGIIPAFNNEVNDFRMALQNVGGEVR